MHVINIYAYDMCLVCWHAQVSGSKMWQMERSCMCCQESGEREASVSLFCPRAKPGEKKFRKVRFPRSIRDTTIRERDVRSHEEATYESTLVQSHHRSFVSSQQRSLPRQPRVSRGHVVFVSRSSPGQSAIRTRTRNVDRERERPIQNEGEASLLIVIFFLPFFEGRGNYHRDLSNRETRSLDSARTWNVKCCVISLYVVSVNQVITKAPLDCMCRPCTSVEEYAIIPQEIAGFADEGPFATSAHFRRSSGLQ